MTEGTNFPAGVMARYDFAKLSLKLDKRENILSSLSRSANVEKYFSWLPATCRQFWTIELVNLLISNDNNT